ncbi:MAG: response regulator [Planctomycetes bacterium]|nr:response regulator [Planctomycetota bacterium]
MARKIPVLLVDEQTLCQQTAMLFAETRYDLHCFESVDAAQAALNASRFEVAVIDLRATLADGSSFVEHVMDAVPRIRCIAVVERPDIASVQMAMKLGCKGYLAKPVQAESVLKSVNDVAQSSGLLTLSEQELQKRLSRLLRAQRLRQELTLTEMANSIGLSKAQLSQIELGKSWPSFPTLKRITDDALDQPFSELFKAIEQA